MIERKTINRAECGLKAEILKYALLKQRLLSEFPSLDDETSMDTMEGITDLHDMIAAVIRSALLDEALCTGIGFRLDQMKQRKLRLEERAEKKRSLILEAMNEVGLSKIEQPDFTVAVRAGSPSVALISEGDIPPCFWIPQPPKLDRQKLLSELKRNQDIPGAALSNPKPVLTVRTK